MAEAKFYLRPSADISIGHSLYPTDSTNAYSLINEEVSDGSATYIAATVPTATGTDSVCTSSFKLSPNNAPIEKFKVTNAKIICVTKYETLYTSDKSLSFTVTINGISTTSETVYIDDDSFSIEDITFNNNDIFINALNDYINSNGSTVFPEITISVTTTHKITSTKVTGNFDITQLYIELDYNICVERKVLGEWCTAIGAYKKINGVWTKITNGFETLQSNLSKSGHHQECLDAISPTCTETGLTKGYKCSICGDIFVPQQVIPANGHSYATAGEYEVCSVCKHVLDIGYIDLEYHGTATALSVARSNLAATTVGNYALFAGGNCDGNALMNESANVDAYDTSLTRTIPTALSVARSHLGATTVGNYALFAGGIVYGKSKPTTVDAYDTSLTRTIPTALSKSKHSPAATTVGNYALFGGDISNYSTIVDAYDTSLTRIIPTELKRSSDNAATTVGNYALFGSNYKCIDIYDTSLTKTALDDAYGGNVATTVGNYALFAGDGKNNDTNVNAYDTSLTKTSATSLSYESGGDATSIMTYALFGGGQKGNADDGLIDTAIVDAYDTSLTKTIPAELSQARKLLASTTVGNYALFGGGDYGSPADGNHEYEATVDAYTIKITQ